MAKYAQNEMAHAPRYIVRLWDKGVLSKGSRYFARHVIDQANETPQTTDGDADSYVFPTRCGLLS